MMNPRIFALSPLLLALASVFASSVSLADEVTSPTFEVRLYRFAGNTLLPSAEIESLLAEYANPRATFETIQLAVSALESRYLEHGFGAVKVVLPEQDIENGEVHLQVVEGQIGHIMVEGNKHFSVENVRASLPALKEGAQPNMKVIDSALRVANESQAKQTGLVFRQGNKPGEVDAYIRVADENPMRFMLSMDNSGSPGADGQYATGRFRTGFIAQHSNLFDRDHALSFQYMTSPDHVKDVTIFGVGYRVPLYERGDVLEFALGYSNVNSGNITTAAGPIGISGSGQTYSMKYEQFLPKVGDWQHKLTYGLDYRIYKNSVTAAGGGNLVPDSTVHPVSLAYAGNIRLEKSEWSGSITYAHNIPGGVNGKTEDFRLPGGRAEATAHYQLWRYNLSGSYALPADWLLRGAISGQFTRDALISGELFGVGGTDSVRGFYEREVSNDKGQRASVELHTPELAGLLGLKDVRLRALTFYDVGSVSRNKPLAGELLRESIASAGLGLRATIGKSLSLRIDWGVVTESGGNRQVGDKRLHASVIGFF